MPTAEGGGNHTAPQGAGKPWGKQDYSKGCCKPQGLETVPLRGHAWQYARGCTKHFRTRPEHVSVVVYNQCAEHDSAGSGQKRFDVLSASWDGSIGSWSLSGGRWHGWEETLQPAGTALMLPGAVLPAPRARTAIPTHAAPASPDTFSCCLCAVTAVCQERFAFLIPLLSKVICAAAHFASPPPGARMKHTGSLV